MSLFSSDDFEGFSKLGVDTALKRGISNLGASSAPWAGLELNGLRVKSMMLGSLTYGSAFGGIVVFVRLERPKGFGMDKFSWPID